MTEKTYQVALSFAGEDREVVEPIAYGLRENGVAVFYDRFFEAEMWGKNLQEDLWSIYSSDSQYCVIFISKAYLDSEWTKLERRSIQETALRLKSEFLLPVFLEKVDVPGLSKDIAFVDFNNKTTHEMVELICRKLHMDVQESRAPCDRLIVEIASTHHFFSSADFRMHTLHAQLVHWLGAHECSIVGCLPKPHRVQLSLTFKASERLVEAFHDKTLDETTNSTWVSMACEGKCDAVSHPRQVPVVNSAGGIPAEHVVCHAPAIAGYEKEAKKALAVIGHGVARNLEDMKAYVNLGGCRHEYFHSNFLKPGYDCATKIACETGFMDLFDYLINATCSVWPDYEKLKDLERVHIRFVEYYVFKAKNGNYDAKFFRGAMNIRYVD